MGLCNARASRLLLSGRLWCCLPVVATMIRLSSASWLLSASSIQRYHRFRATLPLCGTCRRTTSSHPKLPPSSAARGEALPSLLAEVRANLEAIRQKATRLKLESSWSANSSDTSKIRAVFLLGVSGGCDSVALFHLLRVALDRDRDALHVVHFDHRQRGKDSDADRELVHRLCREHGVPLDCYYWGEDDNDDDPQPKAFSQERARTWRRTTMTSRLDALLRENHLPLSPRDYTPTIVGILLTAHHLDDANETLLLKLLRGAHVTHLQGMDLFAVDEGNGHIWGRPLLTVPKAALIQYLEQNNLEWREDESNRSDKYLRNRIRNELVPLLVDLVGGDDRDGAAVLQRRLNHLSQQSRDVEQHLNHMAQQYLRDTKSMEDGAFHLPPDLPLDVVAQHALHFWFTGSVNAAVRNFASSASANGVRTVDFSYEQLQRVCRQLHEYPGNRRWRLDVGHQWSVAREGSVLRLHHPCCLKETAQPAEEQLRWKVIDMGTLTEEALIPDSSSHSLILRVPTRLLSACNASSLLVTTADSSLSFRPPWRDRALPLWDFLRGQRVPLHRRGQTPVVVWGCLGGSEGEVVPCRPEVAAVYVEPKQSWCVAYEFSESRTTDSLAKDAVSIIRVELGELDYGSIKT